MPPRFVHGAPQQLTIFSPAVREGGEITFAVWIKVGHNFSFLVRRLLLLVLLVLLVLLACDQYKRIYLKEVIEKDRSN